MKTPLRTWQKTALAALLSVCAIGASATTSSVVPVATDALATEDISALDAGDTLSSAWSTSASSIDDVASVEAAAIVLDTGDDSLTYTPASVSSTAHAELSLTFSAATTAPAAPTGAQTAITVYSDNGTTNYYVWSKGAASSAALADAEWVQVPTLVPATGTPVSVAFTIDYAKGVVAYVVGGVNAGEYWLATSATQISSLNFQGTGTLTGSIVTKAAATASILPAGGTETFYATEAEALANASSGATLSLWTYDSTNSQWSSSASTLYKVTLSWPADIDSVSYTVDGTAGAALTVADGSYEFYAADGSAIALSGSNAYKTHPASGTVAADDLTVALAPAGIAWYFPQTATAGQDGSAANPYEIDSATALDALRAAVAAGYGANLNYTQTANIDMTTAGPFAGIGTYAKVPTAGTPFLGTYNGQNYTISNVTRAAGNTQGIFNQVGPSGVIENLVVENMAFDSSLSGEYGFAIVGNAGGGATLRNLTAAGTFGSASKPGTHNMAGIVVRLAPGATSGAATTIDSCTNNATIYGAYTKLGGINAIVQNQTGFVDGKVVFENCANNGTLVCKRTAAQAAETNGAVTGQAGILGYFSGTNVELTDCYGNGVIVSEDGANTDKDGALVGWTYGGTIKDNGGNSAPSDKKMIGTWGSATETGFQYATVANGVATTLAPPYTLEDGETYLLEGNVASGTVYTLAADGDSIAFDTSLGYTFGGDVAGATGLTVSNATANDVITYTAATQTFQIRWIDGDGSVLATDTVDYGDTPAYAGATTPTKAADAQYTYTFANAWSPAIVAATADADYTATFNTTVNQYTITWKDGDGNTLTTTTVNYGDAPAYPANGATPTKAATAQYTYTWDNGWDPAIGATTIVTGDATYSATFTSTVNRYTITWEDGSGNVLETDADVPYGDSPSYNGATPTKAQTVSEVYTFSEWKDAGGNAVADPVVGNATYIAQFTASARPYTITFVNYDGTQLQQSDFGYGTTPVYSGVHPEQPSTAQFSYSFTDWLGANNGTGIAAVTGNETYTAQFTQTTREYLVTFFDEDGSTEITRESVAYGSTPTYAGIPTKQGDAQYSYAFDGWTNASVATPTLVANLPAVTADTSYAANYRQSVNTYKIYWVDYDGSSIATDDVAYGTVPTAPANPTRAQDAQYTYAFDAWSPAVVAVTGTATYTATYTSTLRVYTILWVVNGTTVETDANVAYGATPSYDGATPTKASTTLFTYTFSGWSPAVAPVTGDATYVAQFNAIARLRPPVLRLADPTLSAVALSGPSMVVSGEVSSESEGEIVIAADPATAALSDIDSEGAFTATFADVAWNQPLDWSLAASVGDSETTVLAGSAYNKAETQWFSKAADALDTVTGFGDIEAGVAPENASAAGQQVRIQTVLDISASGSTETPDVGNARGGLAVLALNDEDAAYYAFTGDSSKGTNGWVKLYGATPVDGDADLLIVADMDTLDARYYIDGVALYALENEAPVYAISIGGSDKTLSAIGFANPDGVKAPVVAEYDVPYVAAIGNTGYTTAAAAISAVAKDGTETLELLANVDPAATINLASGESVKVKAGSFTGLTVATEVSGKEVRTSEPDANGVVTYDLVDSTATVIWVVEGRDNVTETYAIGDTPEYPEDAAAPAKAATAQYTYTFLGWNTDSTATTALSSLAPVAAGGATYYAVFSSSVNSYGITWTDHSGTVKTETLEYGATPTAPAAAPAQYVENGLIYTGTWPTPANVTGTATYAAVYDAGTPAVATVLSIADAGATTNVLGTYASLAAAVAAAPSGSTVALLANETIPATKTTTDDRIVVTQPITIDFGEYTLSVAGELEPTDNWAALYIAADTTVKGTTGGVNCLDKAEPDAAGDICGVYGFNVIEGATLTFDSGTYHGGGTIAQASLGSIVVNGGTFTVTPYADSRYGSDFAFNCKDAPYTAGTAGISISGGTFVGFDPQNSKAEGAGTDFTDDGYVAIEDPANPGTFVVQEGYNVTFQDEDGTVLEAQRVPAGDTPVYGGTAPTKASTDSAVYAFSGWSPAIVAAAADTTYTAQFSSIYLDPASLAINYNCYGTVSVSNAPAGATFFWTMYTNDVAFSSLNGPLPISSGKTTSTLKFYAASTPVTDGWAVVSITNGAEVITLKAPVTVKDVAAVVDGVEYAKADLDAAGAAALANGKTLGLYVNGPTITLAEGQTLVSQVLSERNTPTPSVKAPAGTAEKVYTVNTAIDNATKTRTYTLTYDTPTVMYTSTDGETVEYLDANFKMSKDGTYKLLKDVERGQLSVGNVDAVLDLDGHEFASTLSGSKGAIYVDSLIGNASLTIRDTAGGGSIVAENCYAIWGNRNAAIAIEGGEIVGKADVVYLSNAADTLTITGGTFRMASGSANFMLNMLDSARGTITVTGGSFQGFDPANNSAEGAGTSFLPATGYVSVADDPSSGWYTVYEAVTVSFVNGKGAAPADQVIGKGKTATAPAAPEAEGFTFDGWFAPNAETAFDFATPVTADLTLTAQWTEDVVENVGAKAENGFVILDKADPAAAGKQLAFTKFEIKGSTVEAAISAALANPNAADTATVKAVYTATLDASAAKVYVNATVTDIDVAKGTATVTFALPAGNAAFFRGFDDYDAGTDKP